MNDITEERFSLKHYLLETNYCPAYKALEMMVASAGKQAVLDALEEIEPGYLAPIEKEWSTDDEEEAWKDL